MQIASRSGKPRGLEWTSCDFDDAVVYARDRRSGELSAFVAITIGFEAVEGGPMEGVEAVGNLRAATAVFRVRRRSWATDGRAIFNLNPTEAVRYFQENLELVGHEPRVKRKASLVAASPSAFAAAPSIATRTCHRTWGGRSAAYDDFSCFFARPLQRTPS